ncbi:hypothetical protein B0H13DRAFT_1877024 [Mycena leptocephala]|nr:hypothetical protein B0H13DRAFT_1877024 [Mycena leptocephala]
MSPPGLAITLSDKREISTSPSRPALTLHRIKNAHVHAKTMGSNGSFKYYGMLFGDSTDSNRAHSKRRATSSIYLFKPFKSSGSFCCQPRSYVATYCLQSRDAYHAGIIEVSKSLEPENLPVIVSADGYLTHVPTNTNLWSLISLATHHRRPAVHKRSILGTKGNQREPVGSVSLPRSWLSISSPRQCDPVRKAVQHYLKVWLNCQCVSYSTLPSNQREPVGSVSLPHSWLSISSRTGDYRLGGCIQISA